MSARPAPTASPRPVYPSDLARSARRRTQKAALRTGRQQEAHDVASRLEELAKEHPDYADLLNRTALGVRARGNSNPDKDADAILFAISKPLPARTLAEIASDTGMLKQDVKQALIALVATKLVKEVHRPEAAVEYWPTGKQCGDVLP